MAIHNNRPISTPIERNLSDLMTPIHRPPAGVDDRRGPEGPSEPGTSAPSLTHLGATGLGPKAERATVARSMLNADSSVALRQLQANQQLESGAPSNVLFSQVPNLDPLRPDLGGPHQPPFIRVQVGGITIDVREMNAFRGVPLNDVPGLLNRAMIEKAHDDRGAYADDIARYLERNGTASFERAVASYNRDFGASINPDLTIRPLIGLLLTGPAIQLANDRAVSAVLESHPRLTGKILREMSVDRGYYNSVGHRAWAQAAEARTAGRIPADWWIEFDPYGGTAGNGPSLELTGMYPGLASKTAMAHDTDWSLGRYFGYGPMAALRDAVGYTPERLGRVGLTWPLDGPFSGIDSYLNGHPDWIVRYN